MQLFLVIGTISDQRWPIKSRSWRHDEAPHKPVPHRHGQAHGQEGFGAHGSAETSKGKNMVISGELRNRLIKPHNPEVGVWKENVL
jgi:hypothetical protein